METCSEFLCHGFVLLDASGCKVWLHHKWCHRYLVAAGRSGKCGCILKWQLAQVTTEAPSDVIPGCCGFKVNVTMEGFIHLIKWAEGGSVCCLHQSCNHPTWWQPHQPGDRRLGICPWQRPATLNHPIVCHHQHQLPCMDGDNAT